MTRLNYWVTESDYTYWQQGICAWIVYMKCEIEKGNEQDGLESLESLDRDALEAASEKYGIVNPCILRRLETKEYFTGGEIVYMIVSKDDARAALAADAASDDD